MYQVGTGAGDVHKQKQGTGLGTVLTPGKEIQYAYLLNQDREKKLGERKAAKDAALAKINAGNDYWYKHEAELGSRVTGLREKGAQLISSGIADPFSSQDPRAIEFRKEYDTVAQMTTASKQLKDQYTAYKQDIDKAGPDDYDDDTVILIDKYYDTPLSEIVKSGLTPPHLIKKRPYTDAFAFMGKNMEEWSKSWNGSIPDDNKVNDFVNALVTDPANKANISRTYSSKLAQMSPEERTDLEARAKAAFREPFVQMAIDDANRWKKSKEPFNALKLLSAAAAAAESGLNYRVNATPDARSKTYDKGDLNKALDAVVTAAFNERPEWLDYYQDRVPRNKDENDGEYASRVRAKMKEEVAAMVGTETSFERTQTGQEKQEFEAQRNQWIQDVRSGDQIKGNAAAQWAINSKVFGNLNVEWAEIKNNEQGPFIMLTTRTPLEVSAVKSEMAGSLPGELVSQVKVEEVQGVKYISIPIGEERVANQFLAELYDTTYKLRGKQNYDPKISERTPQTVDELQRKKSQQTPNINVPLVDPSAPANYLFK